MNKVTNERLQKIASWREQYGNGHNVVIPAEEAEALARELLALREAGKEPVAYIGERMLESLQGDGGRTCGRVWKASVDELSGESRIPLYAAPQLSAVPELVPVPDVLVGNALWDGSQCTANMHECKEIYQAMIAAAPKPEV